MNREVEQPFAAEMGDFLRFCISERALAPDTIRHYRLYIGEFLIWLDGQGKTLCQVTLEDISAHINGLSQRRLSRTSLAIHVAKLRNFFRYAESKRWCGTGLAAIDAPRIYGLESLPRGPAVERCPATSRVMCRATGRPRFAIMRCCCHCCLRSAQRGGAPSLP